MECTLGAEDIDFIIVPAVFSSEQAGECYVSSSPVLLY